MWHMSTRIWAAFALLCVGLVALVPRTLGLGAFLSPDEPRWHANTVSFLEGLETGDLKKLYQQPHPGITTMWLSWPAAHDPSWAHRKLPHAVGVTALTVLATWLAMRRWGVLSGFCAGLLLALNPYFVAHSRILAMDALLSGFLLTSVLALLLWRVERRRGWLVLSGVLGGLAVLSKLAGVVLVPFVLFILVWDGARSRDLRSAVKQSGLWLVAGTALIFLLFPTVVAAPTLVWHELRTFFLTEHYGGAVHALGPRWYAEALLLWTTPLQFFALLGIPFLRRLPRDRRVDVGILSAFAALFLLAMQISLKKGDRYLLPDFVFFDVLAVLLLSALLQGVGALRRLGSIRSTLRAVLGVLVVGAFAWQVRELVRLHPYVLAYRNPWFRALSLHRPMGWGEGLDLAAEYLNAKPNSEQLLVASYYEGPFDYRFNGEVTSAERLAKETPKQVGADYVVLYRTMVGRAPDRWETKVLAQFRDKIPEKIISLNGEEYVWIYRTK